MNDGSSATPQTGGLRRALARAGTSVLMLLRTRLELASIEFREERERTVTRLALVVIAASCLAFATLMASGLVVVLFWDTHRVLAIAVLTLLYAAVGVGALWRLKADSRASPPPFAATLAELERDREWITEQLQERGRP